MNCQEVMEYMQRQLDGDLGEFESAKMHEHIRQCADCAAMYERLKRLSAELENLPKVTPPFSLVDAILPKLDEIDRTRAAASADAGAAEFAGSAGSVTRAMRRRNSRFNLRILGGVVAASIVMGIFIVTNNEERLKDSLPGSSASMESSASDSSGSADLNLLMEVKDQYGVMVDAVDATSSGRAMEFSDGSNRQSSSPDHADDGGTKAGDGSGYGSGSSSGHGSSGLNAGSDSDAGEHHVSPPDLQQGGAEKQGAADWNEEPAVWPVDGLQMGITGFVEEQAADRVESVSPDGSWIAVFADSRVIVRDREGNTRFEGEERTGAIAAFGWSDDGAYFRYEVRLADGESEIYRVDPASGTETKE